MVQFSSPTKIVTVTASVDTSKVRTWAAGYQVTEGDIRDAVDTALRGAARSNGATVESLEVTVTNGPRTVTLTEDEYNALTGGSAA